MNHTPTDVDPEFEPPRGQRGDAVRLMTVPEVAGALRLARKTVYTLLWSGALGYVRIGRWLRIPRNALEGFIADRMIVPSLARNKPAGESRSVSSRTQRSGSNTRSPSRERRVHNA